MGRTGFAKLKKGELVEKLTAAFERGAGDTADYTLPGFAP